MYSWKFTTVYIIMISGILLWTIIGIAVKKKENKKLIIAWKIINMAGMLVGLYGILFYTVLDRSPSDTHTFTFFASYSNEFYREMLMNAFLYFPFGLTISTLLGPWSILISFVLSISIESWQYFAGSGLAQGTDVIMNTLGVAIGCLPWILVKCGVGEKLFQLLKRFYYFLKRSPLASVLKPIYEFLVLCEYHICCIFWSFVARRETAEEKQSVIDNVTFIYKSFERHSMAKRLYHNIQRYYPGVKVIICDDSKEPLNFEGPQIIHLPFNSGLSKGLQALLAAVDTPYTMRMDDDLLLTPKSRISEQLKFLTHHDNIDLAAIQMMPCRLRKPKKMAQEYLHYTMSGSGRKPLIPIGTKIDDNHIVSAKTPNVFLARTNSYREVGYDENIRMIDHHEFFYRANGVVASVMDTKSFVFHYHNRFDSNYDKYRGDIAGDARYIRMKYAGEKYS